MQCLAIVVSDINIEIGKSIMSDFITRYTITLFSGSSILAVGVILLMLSVPFANEWKKFRTVRMCLAITCFVLSASNFASCFALDNELDAQLFSTMTLIVASYQAMLFTTASLVFVQSPASIAAACRRSWASSRLPECSFLCRNSTFPACSRSCSLWP